MVYAIGKVIGKHNGYNVVVIENCDEQQFIGTKWMNNQPFVQEQLPYLVSFDPQDQFCQVSKLPKGGHC